MGGRGISGFIAESSRVSLVAYVHGCGKEVLGRVSLRASFGMFLAASDRACGWKVVSRRMLLGLLLGVSMVVLDRGMGREVSHRVFGCLWWWSEGVLWEVRVLLVIFDCVGGVLLVEVDCGCGWKALRRVLSRVSLEVHDRKCRGGCRLFSVACVTYMAIGFLGVAGGV